MRHQAPRHRDHRGPQRAPAGPGPRRRPQRPRGERLLRLLGLRRRRHRRHPATGTSTGSCGCARRRSATRESYFPRYAALTDDEAVAEALRIWDTINGPNLDRRTCCPPAPAPPWCCARTPTTRCATSGCASSDGPPQQLLQQWSVRLLRRRRQPTCATAPVVTHLDRTAAPPCAPPGPRPGCDGRSRRRCRRRRHARTAGPAAQSAIGLDRGAVARRHRGAPTPGPTRRTSRRARRQRRPAWPAAALPRGRAGRSARAAPGRRPSSTAPPSSADLVEVVRARAASAETDTSWRRRARPGRAAPRPSARRRPAAFA